MYKRICVLIFIIVFFSLFNFNVVAEVYTQEESGVSFTVPDRWEEEAFIKERDFLKVKFADPDSSGIGFLYGDMDMWAKMPESYKVSLSRTDLNNSYFTVEDIKEIVGVMEPSSVAMVYYNNLEYYKLTCKKTLTVSDITLNYDVVYLIRLDNAWLYCFMYMSHNISYDMQEFETLMNSVKYPITHTNTNEIEIINKEEIYVDSDDGFITNTESDRIVDLDENGGIKFNFPLFLLSLLMTISIYTLPVAIYRFVIRKYAMEESSAKKFTIIYGVIAFFIMTFLNGKAAGGAILLWSFINYKLLISGRKKVMDNTYVSENLPQQAETDELHNHHIEEPDNGLQGGFKVFVPDDEEFERKVFETDVIEEDIQNDLAEPKEKVEKHQVLFCRKCGVRLVCDSGFCHKCGTKVE